MAPTQQGAIDHRLPPLGLHGLSRVAFQPRAPPPGGLPPLGLTGRVGVPSFSIGTAGFEHVPPPTTLPRRRVGLARPSRPPAPNESGSSNWSASVGGASTGSGGGAEIASSTFVGFTFGSGWISFGGGGNESLGFTFNAAGGANTEVQRMCSKVVVFSSHVSSHVCMSKGTGAHNGLDMMNGENTTGSAIGYRGTGYNSNFAHADEYPPSQEAQNMSHEDCSDAKTDDPNLQIPANIRSDDSTKSDDCPAATSRICVKHVVEVVNTFPEFKRFLVTSIGFGGMHDLQMLHKLNLKFSVWTMSKIFLLDNLDLGIYNKQHASLPRVKVFDQASIRGMIIMANDVGKPVTSYASAPIRHHSTVCYARSKYSHDEQSSSRNTTNPPHEQSLSCGQRNAHSPNA
ncbi:hypothetical protein D1007_20729 [Hordeum vulgare]|nr:hypothetical protein D1007_20729 [Hordeum vulgare]